MINNKFWTLDQLTKTNITSQFGLIFSLTEILITKHSKKILERLKEIPDMKQIATVILTYSPSKRALSCFGHVQQCNSSQIHHKQFQYQLLTTLLNVQAQSVLAQLVQHQCHGNHQGTTLSEDILKIQPKYIY